MVDGEAGEGEEREEKGTRRNNGVHEPWAKERGGRDGGRWDRDTQVARSKRLEGGRGREDEARLGYNKLSGDDSIAYRPLGSPEEVFHVLLRYTILYEEAVVRGCAGNKHPQLCQPELVVVQLFRT